jgi:hypothetical protein
VIQPRPSFGIAVGVRSWGCPTARITKEDVDSADYELLWRSVNAFGLYEAQIVIETWWRMTTPSGHLPAR